MYTVIYYTIMIPVNHIKTILFAFLAIIKTGFQVEVTYTQFTHVSCHMYIRFLISHKLCSITLFGLFYNVEKWRRTITVNLSMIKINQIQND